jgi:hypothetical protein
MNGRGRISKDTIQAALMCSFVSQALTAALIGPYECSDPEGEQSHEYQYWLVQAKLMLKYKAKPQATSMIFDKDDPGQIQSAQNVDQCCTAAQVLYRRLRC